MIVPNYNHAEHLSRRLDSILAQTFRDFELIILDDASTDDSLTVITKYLEVPGVRFQRNSANSGGPFSQWNRGVALARGEYVWLAESDDYAEPTFLASLLPLLQADPSAGIAYCQSCHIDHHGHNHGALYGWTDDIAPGRWRNSFRNEGPDEVARYMVLKNPVLNASAVLFRRSVFLQVGGAPTNFRQCGDWVTWARMLLLSAVHYHAEPLNYFRAHSGNVRSATRGAVAYREFLRAQSIIASHVRLAPAITTELCRRALSAQKALLFTRPRPDLLELLCCLGATLRFAVSQPRASARCLLHAALNS